MSGKLNLLKASWSFTSLAAKVGVIAVATTIGLANVVGSAGATLDAVASNAGAAYKNIATGTLSLSYAPSGETGRTAGFSSNITGMKPLDTQSRFVDYTTGADMGIKSPALSITASGAGATILTDATYGLRVSVQSCGTYTWTSSTDCASGTPATLLASTPLSSLIGNMTSNLSGFELAEGNVNHLKFTILLPDQAETNTNGTITFTGSKSETIQGKSAAITWIVTVGQPDTVNGNA